MSTVESYGIITDSDGGGGPGAGVVHNHTINLSFSTNEGAAVYKSVIPPSASNPAPATSPTHAYQAGSSGNGTAYMPVIPPSVPNPAPATTPTHAFQAGSSGNGTAVAVSINAATAADGEQMKRKRGRPRKYPLDGTMMPGLTALQPRPEAAFSSPASVAAVSSGTGKKARGRPRGSGQKQRVAPLGFLLGGGWSPGIGFMPHVITIKAGEDVSSKIMSFSQSGTQTICILSANGAISNVTLRQAATSGGSVTYEGRFEILSLSGSYTVSESGGRHSRTGGLSVLLAGPDGRVLGGGVAGLLVAAAPVQVIIGCFIPGQELKPPIQADPVASVPPNLNHGTSAAGSPGSGSGPGSPLNQSTGVYNNSNNPPSMTTFSWK